ncbi:hypothetical protein NG42_09890 [Winslowiella iniecta]|uniref:Uncharacterized protein n=1 Tax=Winslowiella iniecta TaxID=1560201 RepID=A0A0L7T408_9GAMM|nr:hypothetical protein NG42_09890 [Winslowiella iniecta]KOC94079.1 hypothetical protein NG43_06430 [Winslowiella iniecta]
MKLVTANELAKKYGVWLVEAEDPEQELEQQRLVLVSWYLPISWGLLMSRKWKRWSLACY